jgi:hypothetical protein
MKLLNTFCFLVVVSKTAFCLTGNELLAELDLASLRDAADKYQTPAITTEDNGDDILAEIEQELTEAIINVAQDNEEDMTR